MKTESKERQAVSDAYHSPDWKKRVKAMEDDQIIAIYKRLKTQGRIK